MRLLTFLKILRLKTEYHEMMRYEAIQSIGFNSTGYQDIQQQKRKGNNGRMYGLCWSTQLSPDEAVRFESLVVHDDAVRSGSLDAALDLNDWGQLLVDLVQLLFPRHPLQTDRRSVRDVLHRALPREIAGDLLL